ncbi:MAG TPA: NAD(P)H-binding protein, partial [Chitinolyticbacter sp.]|nr:NAD(P)H-binding protein [Chitinolyticbacter sp.]
MAKALVLGATGGIGGEMAAKLLARGWQVEALTRNAADRPDHGIRWHAGDALNRDDVLRAAAGCKLIVHAVNPPGYRNWGRWVLPMVDNTIAAAEANGARIVLPGTVYNYAAGDRVVDEATPQEPDTRKGEIRVALETRLQQAAARGRARVLIVRAGDYFGPRSRNSWFAQAL